jgi:hypothetical protein
MVEEKMYLKQKPFTSYMGFKSVKTVDKLVRECGLPVIVLPSGQRMYDTKDGEELYEKLKRRKSATDEIADKIMQELS